MNALAANTPHAAAEGHQEHINPTGGSARIERLAYGIADASVASGISRSKLYELLKSGELASVKIGARRLIRARDLADLLDRGSR